MDFVICLKQIYLFQVVLGLFYIIPKLQSSIIHTLQKIGKETIACVFYMLYTYTS